MKAALESVRRLCEPYFYVSESTQNQNLFFGLFACLLVGCLVVWLVGYFLLLFGWLVGLGLAREISLTADMI